MMDFTDKSNAWTQAWLEMQKHYMDAWTKLSRQTLAGGAGASPFAAAAPNVWADGFEQWSRLFAQGMPVNARDVSTRLMDLGKSYLGMSENFWHMLQLGKQDASDWQDALKRTLSQNGNGFTGTGTDPWSGFANLWGLPVNNWQRMATALSPFPGELEKALRPEHLPPHADLTGMLQKITAMPALGYTREWQDQQQEWMRLFTDYTRTVQAFGSLLGKVVTRALEVFGHRITEKASAGATFDGLREIYNLWIDCGEEAYAEIVATPEFPQLQADMVNALMRVKRHGQLMSEEFMTALNIPTRSEMNTSHQRVHDLQKQVIELREALENVRAQRTVPANRTSAGSTKKPAAHRTQPKTRKD